jgi:pyruvate dehydrogenase (quinone)
LELKITYKTNAAASRRTPVVHVNPMRLVMLLFMQVEPVVGIALYSANAILHVRGDVVWEMVKENFL